ncbi:thioredoxin family protein [Jeotgalibacillus haloalkalitolerans]|uniref:Thioredoxin family protein n=1 Tax=Jeotgalibacillus haloalkalitolerans TaxID=3104292 RepID=A0ABU5KQX8_9BACL|nr:thioredoxin family protein [Jeotgalibacillus sp. HH7-29]MDZ5713575.1 thioredoxin family protein [Jeotgalibacillus sp. HH7-29]
MQGIKNNDQFRETVNKDEAVIVKFTADWCPDCRRMDMFIDDIMDTYNEYGWYELNRDELPEIADEQEVMGIPSLLIFKNGEKKAHLHSANAKSPEQVKEFLDAQK